MTTPKTPRRTELENTAIMAATGVYSPYNTLPALTQGRLDGYRMAQADYAELVEAARNTKDYLDGFQQSMGEKMPLGLGELFEELRDALAVLFPKDHITVGMRPHPSADLKPTSPDASALAQEQGIEPVKDPQELVGGWPEEDGPDASGEPWNPRLWNQAWSIAGPIPPPEDEFSFRLGDSAGIDTGSEHNPTTCPNCTHPDEPIYTHAFIPSLSCVDCGFGEEAHHPRRGAK